MVSRELLSIFACTKIYTTMGICASTSVNEKEALEQFNNADVQHHGTLDHDSVESYVSSHAELWAMLGVNLGLGDEECKRIATDVAFCMVEEVGPKHESGTMTAEQFSAFYTSVKTPKGQLEFFHRTIFNAFDKDNNGIMDQDELDMFLNTFYDSHSIFKGDSRLPEKEELKKMVNKKLDADHDGGLSFDEIHCLISGKLELSQ